MFLATMLAATSSLFGLKATSRQELTADGLATTVISPMKQAVHENAIR